MENLQENENKECVLCGFKDHQEDIVETPEGFAHRICLDEQDVEPINHQTDEE